MKDFVSNRWMHMVALAASMLVGWVIFVPYGFPWTGLVWVSLTFSAALWMGTSWARSTRRVIDDIEAEPLLVAAPSRVAIPVPKSSRMIEGDKRCG
jgi:hypothetical protein